MPRKKLIRSSQFPYHITSRSNNREWFYIPLENLWDYCQELLSKGEKLFKVKIYAFVLMSNHYHLCVLTPEANIDQFMRFFNKSLGQRISWESGRINRTFGAPYKWTLITNEAYFLSVIRYVYQNPLRASICERCENYPYSDLSARNADQEFLEWINRKQCRYDSEKTRKNLRKYQL